MINISKPNITKEQIDSVIKTMESGMIACGPAVVELEKRFKEYVGTTYALATNSGTSALHCALEAVDVRNYEVITTPFTFVATGNAILMAGGTPVFVDVDKDYNINPALIEAAITSSTKAILTVDLYGKPCNYEAINRIAKRHNLIVIADAAQAIGAYYQGLPVGGIADITCFSFYATKNVMTGEGGMVTTNNKEYADFITSFRNHGQGTERYDYQMMGFNYRMTDLAASIGLEQIDRIGEITQKRNDLADIYDRCLPKEILKPKTVLGHCYHQYTIRTKFRNRIMEALKKAGIGFGVYYPKPLHKFNHFNSDADCPKAEQYANEVLSLPIHPLLSKQDVEFICRTIKEA